MLPKLLFTASVLANVPSFANVKDKTIENGSGCSEGGVHLYLDDSKTKLTFSFDHFKVFSNKDQPITAIRRNCQVNFQVDHSQGWQYAVVKTDFQGWINIPNSVSATQSVTFYVSGQQAQSTQEYKVVGPKQEHFQVSSDFINPIWSPCGTGKRVNLNTQYRLSRSTEEWAEFGPQFENGKSTHTFQIQWRTC
jgi:hypothetical protein